MFTMMQSGSVLMVSAGTVRDVWVQLGTEKEAEMHESRT